MSRIPLRSRAGTVITYVLVDDEDYEDVSQFRWARSGSGYVTRKVEIARHPTTGRRRQQTIDLHKQVMGFPDCQVDHINHDKLDCRKANLRLAPGNHRDNCQNRAVRQASASGYRGVDLHKRSGKWQARAMVDYKNHYLGLYATAEEADAAVRAFRRDHMPFSEEAAA